MTPQSEMKPELKPCPFCGGEVEIFTRNVRDEFGIYMNEWSIICKDDSCYLSRKGKTVEQSIQAWNTRSSGGQGLVAIEEEVADIIVDFYYGNFELTKAKALAKAICSKFGTPAYNAGSGAVEE